jgi:hypothetical protein
LIICGFPGTGKSTMAKSSNWVDLESTPFSRRGQWLLYAEVAKHMSDNGYTVMVSTHEEMLEALELIKARYTVVVPPYQDYLIYRERYINRGNSLSFITKLSSKWVEWISNIINTPSVLKTVVVLPKDGCIQAWAKDINGGINNG